MLTRFGPLSTNWTDYLRTTPDGKFSATGLTPGHYAVVARATRGAGASASASGRGATPRPTGLWATMEIDVYGRDVSGLVVTLQSGVNVSGRLVFRGRVPASLSSARISLYPAGPATAMPQGFSTQPNADGTFTIGGVAPGEYRLSAYAPGATSGSPWTVLSAVLEGRDFIDDAIEVRPNRDLAGVVVTFTDRPAELSGTVFDDSGRPTPDYFIVVFPTEKRFWTAGSRRVAHTRPANDGSFKITTLPPGEYYLCAVTDLDGDNVADEGFLAGLVGASTRLALGEGEKKQHDVRVPSGEGRGSRAPRSGHIPRHE
jgi:hypothetical protein